MQLTETDKIRHRLDPKGFVPEALQGLETDDDYNDMFVDWAVFSLGLMNKEGEMLDYVTAFYDEESRDSYDGWKYREYYGPAFKGFRLEYADGEVRWLDYDEMTTLLGDNKEGNKVMYQIEESINEAECGKVWA